MIKIPEEILTVAELTEATGRKAQALLQQCGGGTQRVFFPTRRQRIDQRVLVRETEEHQLPENPGAFRYHIALINAGHLRQRLRPGRGPIKVQL